VHGVDPDPQLYLCPLLQVLASCSNVMMWSPEDICLGLADRKAIAVDDASSAGSIALHTTIRLCQQVYREYQRQLIDPEAWHMGGLEKVRWQHSVHVLLAGAIAPIWLG
jgi:hypothetical protein